MVSTSNEERPACGATDIRRLEELSGTLSRLAGAPPGNAARLALEARGTIDMLVCALARGAGQTCLNAKEAAVYRALCTAADRDELCPTADDLLEAIDFGSHSTTVAIVKRLERLGLISVRRFQRGRRVQIIATGKWTREPKCRAPHWRERLAT